MHLNLIDWIYDKISNDFLNIIWNQQIFKNLGYFESFEYVEYVENFENLCMF